MGTISSTLRIQIILNFGNKTLYVVFFRGDMYPQGNGSTVKCSAILLVVGLYIRIQNKRYTVISISRYFVEIFAGLLQ